MDDLPIGVMDAMIDDEETKIMMWRSVSYLMWGGVSCMGWRMVPKNLFRIERILPQVQGDTQFSPFPPGSLLIS
jgi:hypothetical protein